MAILNILRNLLIILRNIVVAIVTFIVEAIGAVAATALAILIVLVLFIVSFVFYLGAPSTIELMEVGRVSAGGTVTITYRVTVTYASTSANDFTVDIEILEDDGLFNDTLINGVTVTVPAGSTQGSARFMLTCGESGTAFIPFLGGDTYLEGVSGSSIEDSHQVFAQYGNLLFPDIESTPNTIVDCREDLGLGE